MVPSGEVSTEYLPVEALSPSPQVPDGLIWMSATSTASGSSSTTTTRVDVGLVRRVAQHRVGAPPRPLGLVEDSARATAERRVVDPVEVDDRGTTG